METIHQMVSGFTNDQATRLDGISQTYIGGEFPTEVAFSTPENLMASVNVGYEGLVAEYGTMDRQPTSWGLSSLTEAARG